MVKVNHAAVDVHVDVDSQTDKFFTYIIARVQSVRERLNAACIANCSALLLFKPVDELVLLLSEIAPML